ncbi:MAG: alkaline phosphatase family protein [candidate division KSB1 bacterium]|nr:alkaline phosphatase family protein [candidate division KSB1 bacterium]
MCASYFWPGSEMRPDYRHPTFFEKYEHNRPYEIRVDGVLKWLQLPEAERPHFITLYFDAVDSKAHQYGTRAAETDSAIARVDRMLGRLIAGLEKLGMLNQVNIIAVSDHGMMDTSPRRVIYLDRILGDTPLRISAARPGDDGSAKTGLPG